MNRPDWAWTLDEALDDEYKARATYAAVIARFGPQPPFVTIKASEERHAAALLTLYRHYGITPIPDRWHGRVAAPETRAEACRAGVAAEIENAGMYERLLSAGVPPDVRQVFLRLRRASQERHLPAFQRCAGLGERDRPAAGVPVPVGRMAAAFGAAGGGGRSWMGTALEVVGQAAAGGCGGGRGGGRGHGCGGHGRRRAGW